MKNKILQYALPVILGVSSLVGNSYAQKSELPTRYELPISQERRTQIVNLNQERQKDHKEKARYLFNESIKDGVFNIEEQTNVYEAYKEFANDLTSYKMQAEDTNLYRLIDENLHGIDFGRPNLENVLDYQGLRVAVETQPTKADFNCVMGITLALGILGIGGLAKLVFKER